MKLSCKEKIRVKTPKTINVKFFKEIVMNSQGPKEQAIWRREKKRRSMNARPSLVINSFK